MLSLLTSRTRQKAFFRLLRHRYKGNALSGLGQLRLVFTHLLAITPPNPETPETRVLWWVKVTRNFLLSIFIVVISLVVGAYQLAGVTSMAWAHFSIWLGGFTLFVCLWCYFLSHYYVEVKILTIIGGLILFGTTYFIDWNLMQQKGDQEREAKAAQLAQLRSSITASLVIDSITESEIKYHLQVENIGKVVVDNMRFTLKTKDFSGMEAISPFPRRLPPGGKLDFPPPPNSLMRNNKSGQYLSLIAQLFYTAEIGGGKKNMLSQFRYTIAPHDVESKTINPEAWEEQEDQAAPTKHDLLAMAAEKLGQHIGTVSIVPYEIRSDGTPNTFVLASKSKKFLFDPKLRIVSFAMTTLGGRSTSLELPLPETEKKMHIIIFSWDDSKGAALRVDGTEKEDMQ